MKRKPIIIIGVIAGLIGLGACGSDASDDSDSSKTKAQIASLDAEWPSNRATICAALDDLDMDVDGIRKFIVRSYEANTTQLTEAAADHLMELVRSC